MAEDGPELETESRRLLPKGSGCDPEWQGRSYLYYLASLHSWAVSYLPVNIAVNGPKLETETGRPLSFFPSYL